MISAVTPKKPLPLAPSSTETTLPLSLPESMPDAVCSDQQQPVDLCLQRDTSPATLASTLATARSLNAATALVASPTPTLEPISLRDAQDACVRDVGALAWFVDDAVEHPLRIVIGGRPFFLLTAESQAGSTTKVALERLHSLTIGTSTGNTNLHLALQPEENRFIGNTVFALCCAPQQLKPLAADDARYCLSLICLDINEHATSELIKYPVFAYCEDITGSRRYMGIIAKSDVFFKGIYEFISLDVRDSGAVLSKPLEDDEVLADIDDNSPPGPLPTLKALLAESEDIADVGVAIRTYAEYEVLSGTSCASSSVRPSSITMAVCSDGAHEVLSGPPVLSAVILKIRYVSGLYDRESHPTTSPLFAELRKLKEWTLAMMAARPWEGNTSASTPGVTSQDVDKFLDVMAELKRGAGQTDDAAKAGLNIKACSTGSSALFDPLPPRKDLDFTDKLWMFCQGARSQEELVEILAAVVDNLESGKLKPMVRKTNQSSLANIIRECLRISLLQTAPDYAEQRENVSRTFDFWIEQPLECLVEVGISKLKRDYVQYLVGNDLASWPQLEPFLDPTVPLAEQVSMLYHLHRVVELWSLVRTNLLAISAETLRLVVQAALGRSRNFLAARPADADGGDILADDMSEATRHLNEPLLLDVHLPVYTGRTDNLVGSVVASFEPSLWAMSVSQSAADATITSSGEKAKFAPGGRAFFVHFDRNDRLFPKPVLAFDKMADATADGDEMIVFQSIHQLSAFAYRMVKGVRVA